MRIVHLIRGIAAAALVFLPGSSFAQTIQLSPVVSGLSSPVFVGNADDNLNRLFIVEQGGIIKVLQPGASTPTVFLNITSKMLSGGERGLLGLAFHPAILRRTDGSSFTTRAPGTARSSSRNIVPHRPTPIQPARRRVPILTILHPTNANHNGGMLAFGPDGYLYIGVGDGGGANDPPNNAQNIDTLLGKILRINVEFSARYTSPRRQSVHRSDPGPRRDLCLWHAKPVAVQLRPRYRSAMGR